MGTESGDFKVPEWTGPGANVDLLSPKLFEPVPSFAKRKRKKGKVEGKDGKECKNKKILLEDNADGYSYLDTLKPGERLVTLLTQLRNVSRNSKVKGIEDSNNEPEDSHHSSGTGADLCKYANKLKRSQKDPSKVERKKKKNSEEDINNEKEQSSDVCKNISISKSQKDKDGQLGKEKSRTKKKKKQKGNQNDSLGNSTDVKGDDEDGSNRLKMHEEKLSSIHKEHKTKNQNGSLGITEAYESARVDNTEAGNKIIGLQTVSKSRRKQDFKTKLQQKLSGAQFRWINEQLYTSTSQTAFEMFSKDPSLFDVYHKGFQSQVESWPQNPIDLIITDLRKRPGDLIVADMGCGEAKIAQTVKQKVHSFDLVAHNKFITACDMSQIPLKDKTVDIVIFCLSLMGKNVSDFLMEASRILKNGGLLKIAEVVSRFDSIEKFIEDVSSFGFKLLSKDSSNKMFVLMDFEKLKRISSNVSHDISLKPCLYKKR